MSSLEELSENYRESLNLNAAPKIASTTSDSNPASTSASQSVPFPLKRTTQAQNDTTPSLPPQMESVRSHTVDEILQMMNKTPLFMTSLENTDDEGRLEENIGLEAFRALQYEGSPTAVAQGFKEQGNEMAKAKRWKDGKEFYTKSLAAISQDKVNQTKKGEEKCSSQPSADEEAGIRKGKDVEEACYVNRALCNLELKNYRSTTLDCASTLRLNPRNVKAYYRSSLALLALDKVAEASDACTRGLMIDSGNTALKSLATKIEVRNAGLLAAAQKKDEREQLARKEKIMLATALKARNIRSHNTAHPPDLEDAHIHLAPDPLSPTSVLHFPVILLYPLHAQSDFIKAFPETDTVPQHLEYILPLPWDEKGEYTLDSVDFYVETASGGLVKPGKKVSLGKLLGSPSVEVMDGVVRVNVVLKGRSGRWIEEVKARKGK